MTTAPRLHGGTPSLMVGLLLCCAWAACSSDDTTDDAAVDPTAKAPRETVPDESVGPIHFRDASERLGNLFRPGGRGVALTDFDQDGWPDVTVLAQNTIHLFRGVGQGLFLPHGEPIEFDFGMAATWADVDGDADLDLYVSSVYEQHGLFLNDGAGGLTNGSDAAGLGGIMPVGGQGASFGDVDGDGDLDLYLCFAAAPHDRVSDPPPAFGAGGLPNRLYINDGAGVFTRGDDSVVSGLATGETFMGIFADFDDDNDVDLFVVHDHQRDEYFENRGGVFVDASAGRLPGAGQESTSVMGVDLADFDGDGQLDMYGTQSGNDALYLKSGERWVNAWPDRMSGYDPSAQITGWGAALADVDNDGDLDVLSTSNYETVFDQEAGGRGGLRQGWMMLLRTEGDGQDRRFKDVSGDVGSIFSYPIDGFGLSVADIDRDGDVDALIGVDGSGEKSDSEATEHTLLLVNDGTASAGYGWLGLAIRQPTPNAFAVGGSVEILGLGIRTRRPILAGASFLSSQSDRLHFGLGRYQRVPAVRVVWPDGHATIWLDVPTGEHTLVRPAGSLRCCDAAGCDETTQSECLARLAVRFTDRCARACNRLRACCGAPESCEQRCGAMPPPEWSALCMEQTGCESAAQCFGLGRYQIPGSCPE